MQETEIHENCRHVNSGNLTQNGNARSANDGLLGVTPGSRSAGQLQGELNRASNQTHGCVTRGGRRAATPCGERNMERTGIETATSWLQSQNHYGSAIYKV